MTTFKDTDLREALRRKYADTPPVPDDLSERLMKGMESTGDMPKHRHWPYITTAIAAAAAILLLVALHLGQGQTGQSPMIAEKPTTPVDSVRQKHHISPATKKTEQHPVVAQTTPTKPQAIHEKTTEMERSKADTTSTVESLADCIARLEAEMENIDDSVRSAHIENLIAADARLQQMVFRIIGKETEQTLNEIEKDSTANYINF